MPQLNVQNSRIVLRSPISSARRLAGVLLVLRRFAERDELENAVVAADRVCPVDDRVRADRGAGADLDVRADRRVYAPTSTPAAELAPSDRRSRSDGSPPLRSRLASDCRRAQRAHQLGLGDHLAVDLRARRELPDAARMTRLNSTSSSSWSPGITGLLKRALSMPTK